MSVPKSANLEWNFIKKRRRGPFLQVSCGVKFYKFSSEKIYRYQVKFREEVPERWDDNADVLIVGSGYAGLAAGIEAKEANNSIKIIEKMKAPGGNSRMSNGGVAAVNTPQQREQGIDDSEDLFLKDMLKAGEGLNRKEPLEFLSKNSWATVKWTMDHLGVKYRDWVNQTGGHSVPRSLHTKEDGGWGIVSKQLAKLEELDVEIETGKKLDFLVVNNESGVAGIKVRSGYSFAKKDSSDVEYFKATKGVILATGGFSNDVEMRKRQWPQLSEEIKSTNHPGATGETLREALRVGANPIQLSRIQLFPLTTPSERGFGKGPFFQLYATVPYGIWIDPKTGRRFVNELDDRKKRVRSMLEVGKEPEYPMAITDSTGVKLLKDEEPGVLDKLLDQEKAYRFNTLKKVADNFGIPEQNLKDEIGKYNSYVIKGEDPDFGKPIPGDAGPLENPPWYVMRIWPKVHYTLGGLETNEKTQVINLEGEPIPNLYAAGEIVGGMYGACRLGGCAILDCLTFGRVAGSLAADGTNPYNNVC